MSDIASKNELRQKFQYALSRADARELDWNILESILAESDDDPILVRAAADLAKGRREYDRAKVYLERIINRHDDLLVPISLELSRLENEELGQTEAAFERLKSLFHSGVRDFDVINGLQSLAICVSAAERIEVLLEIIRLGEDFPGERTSYMLLVRSAIHACMRGGDRNGLQEIRAIVERLYPEDDVLVELSLEHLEADGEGAHREYRLKDIAEQSPHLAEVALLTAVFDGEVADKAQGSQREALLKRVEAMHAAPEQCWLLCEAGLRALEYRKDWDEAEFYWRHAADYGPLPEVITQKLGRYFADSGRFEDVSWLFTEQLRHMDEGAAKSKLLTRHGRLYLERLNNVDAAILAFQEAIKIKPEDADAYRDLSSLYQSEARWDEAIALYLQEARWAIDEQNIEWALTSATYLAEVKLADFQKAIDIQKDLVEQRGAFRDRIRLMILHLKASQPADAYAVLSEIGHVESSLLFSIWETFLTGLDVQSDTETSTPSGWILEESTWDVLKSQLADDAFQPAREALWEWVDGRANESLRALYHTHFPETSSEAHARPQWMALYDELEQEKGFSDKAKEILAGFKSDATYAFDAHVLLAEDARKTGDVNALQRHAGQASDAAPSDALKQQWSLRFLEALYREKRSFKDVKGHIETLLKRSKAPIAIYRFALDVALKAGDMASIKHYLEQARNDDRLTWDDAHDALGLAAYELLTGIDHDAQTLLPIDVDVSFETYEPSAEVLSFQEGISNAIAQDLGSHNILQEATEFLKLDGLQRLDIESAFDDIIATLAGQSELLDFTQNNLKALSVIKDYDGGEFVADVVEGFSERPKYYDAVHKLIRESLEHFRNSDILMNVGRVFAVISQGGTPIDVPDADAPLDVSDATSAAHPEAPELEQNALDDEGSAEPNQTHIEEAMEAVTRPAEPPQDDILTNIKQEPSKHQDSGDVFENSRKEDARLQLKERLQSADGDVATKVASYWHAYLFEANTINTERLPARSIKEDFVLADILNRVPHPAQRTAVGQILQSISTSLMGLGVSDWVKEHRGEYTVYDSSSSEPVIEAFRSLGALFAMPDFEVWTASGVQESVVPDVHPVFIIDQSRLEDLGAHIPMAAWMWASLYFGHHLVHEKTNPKSLRVFCASVAAAAGAEIDDFDLEPDVIHVQKLKSLLTKKQREHIKKTVREFGTIGTEEDVERWIQSCSLTQARWAYIFAEQVDWIVERLAQAQSRQGFQQDTLDNSQEDSHPDFEWRENHARLLDTDGVYHLFRFALSQDAINLKGGADFG